jgi:hypothetical protein
MTPEHQRVVRVPNLEGFQREVPPEADGQPSVVYLLLSEKWVKGSRRMLPCKEVGLSLQSRNARGDIVWLYEAHEVDFAREGPAFPIDQAVMAGMKQLETIVAAHLQLARYDVRKGDYALPSTVKPLWSGFECAVWKKDGADSVTVFAKS